MLYPWTMSRLKINYQTFLPNPLILSGLSIFRVLLACAPFRGIMCDSSKVVVHVERAIELDACMGWFVVMSGGVPLLKLK